MSTDVLAERYGVASPWRRRVLVVAVVVAVLTFGGWTAWALTAQTDPEVSSQLQTFDVVDEHTATATMVIDLRDGDVDATCRLRAFAEDHTVVGEWSFSPDPAAGRRQVQEFRTERRATSVDSLGCTAPGQNRPR